MRYKIENEGDGFYTIKGVPIFKMHDDRGFPCNEEWMGDAVENFRLQKAQDFRPHIIVGHQKKGQYEKESVGFLDNLVLKGKMLYADLVRIPKLIKERIVLNEFPNRSVEILPKSKRVLALALLGGTTPHFTLPQMTYGHRESDEYSLLFRSPDMAFNDEEKKEIFSLVGEALKAELPKVLETFAQDDDTPEIYDMPNEQATEILASGDIPEFFQAEDGALYSQGDDDIYYRWPSWARDKLLAYAQTTLETPTKFEVPATGYAIDPKTKEVYQDGVKIGVVNPTVPADPNALPPIPENKKSVTAPQPGKVAAGTEGAGNVKGDGTPPANPNIIPQKREESDQFAEAEKSKFYELTQKMERMDTANQLLQTGRKAEMLTTYLREQKAAGAPISNIDDVVEYLMLQDNEQITKFKQMLEKQPKIALGKITPDHDNVVSFNEAEMKADYERNKEHYNNMGVDEKDLKWASFVRTGPAPMQIAG